MTHNNYIWTPRGCWILPDPPPPILPVELQEYSYYNTRTELQDYNDNAAVADMLAHMPPQMTRPKMPKSSKKKLTESRVFFYKFLFMCLLLVATIAILVPLGPYVKAHTTPNKRLGIAIGTMLGLSVAFLVIFKFPCGSKSKTLRKSDQWWRNQDMQHRNEASWV